MHFESDDISALENDVKLLDNFETRRFDFEGVGAFHLHRVLGDIARVVCCQIC